MSSSYSSVHHVCSSVQPLRCSVLSSVYSLSIQSGRATDIGAVQTADADSYISQTQISYSVNIYYLYHNVFTDGYIYLRCHPVVTMHRVDTKFVLEKKINNGLALAGCICQCPPESPSVPMCTVTTRDCHLALICSDLRRCWAGWAGLGAATGKWIFSWGPEAHNQPRLDLVTVAANLGQRQNTCLLSNIYPFIRKFCSKCCH